MVPPFSATRMALGDLGECIVGRGAEDTKGATIIRSEHVGEFQTSQVSVTRDMSGACTK